MFDLNSAEGATIAVTLLVMVQLLGQGSLSSQPIGVMYL